MFFRKNKLVAILPANKTDGEILHSHQGLTFGGLISNKDMKVELMLSIFDSLKKYLNDHKIKEFYYKRIPSIYHKLPSDEDKYALFRLGADLWRCDISSTVILSKRIKYSDSRKSIITRAKKNGVEISESKDYAAYWEMLNKVIEERHGAKPVHSLAEMILLEKRFPKNIKLYLAHFEGKCIAGAVFYCTEETIHTQYLATSDFGRQIGALDYLLDEVMTNSIGTYTYFDFGTSNEDDGTAINAGLIFQKEGFGGRGIVHEFYKWGKTNNVNL